MGSMDSNTLEALMAHREETRQHREVIRWTGHWHGDDEDDDHDEEMVVVTGYADNDRDCETLEALMALKAETRQHREVIMRMVRRWWWSLVMLTMIVIVRL